MRRSRPFPERADGWAELGLNFVLGGLLTFSVALLVETLMEYLG